MSYVTPDSFELIHVWFYTNRLKISNDKNSDNKIDISASVAEFSIYEHIGNPYLTADIVYVDDLNLFEMPGVLGTERIEISVATPLLREGTGQYLTTKRFVVSGINAAVKNNEASSVYSISLIEDHGYFNFVQKISKSYHGKGEEIIQQILFDNLGKEVDLEFNNGNPFKESVQSPMRYNVPYLRPLDAAKVVLSNITTSHGMPFFLYSTIHSDRLILTDLETILEKEPWNKDKAATLNPTTSYMSGSMNDQLYNISRYKIGTSTAEETLKLGANGGLGFRYENIDVGDGSFYNQSMNYKNFVLPWLKNINDAVKGNSQVLLVDDDIFDPDPRNQYEDNMNSPKLGEYNATTFAHISTNNFSPDNEDGISSNKTFLNDVVRDASMYYLTKNVYDLEMASVLYLIPDLSRCVGGQIKIEILEDRGTAGQITRSNRSEKKSGNHVILSKRHLFSPHNFKHRVSMQVSRVSNNVTREGVRLVEMLPSVLGEGSR